MNPQAAADKAKPKADEAKALTQTRPALCVQAREGKLCIFMPPVDYLSDYLDLVAAIEDTAAHLSMPVSIEGYTPPNDTRISVFKVTPDPGVIEVNIQPAATWDDLVENTTDCLRTGARDSPGNGKVHARWPTHRHRRRQSPGDRRPHCRRQSLSAPARPAAQHGRLLAQPSFAFLSALRPLHRPDQPASPRRRRPASNRSTNWKLPSIRSPSAESTPVTPGWSDRLFRHLLTDVTGNTHRAEFCIDKLYPPEGAGTRLGLLELRAFEMPPHARMSLTQQLLVRALIAQFWRKPYRQKLIPWGNSLHDRFMLPYFVAS